MEISQHAQRRMQQRGISVEMAALLIKYGKYQYDKGFKIFSLDKKAANYLQQTNKVSKQLLEKLKKLYVVFYSQNNTLITTAYRIHRLKNNRKNHLKGKRGKLLWRNTLMR